VTAKKLLFFTVLLVLAFIMGYSSYRLNEINAHYAQEAKTHERMMQYKPTSQTAERETSFFDNNPLVTEPIAAEPKTNPSIIALREKYPDVVGWITIPNTDVDYPFAQAEDNDYYLHLDLDKNYLFAGTLFMDYRNGTEFYDFSTAIFGHNMKNGSMFGTLGKFNDEAFFRENSTGTIFTAHNTYEIEFMAWLVIASDDAVIYNFINLNDTGKSAFLDYIKNTARHYRDIDATIEDNLVMLSTCNYDFADARMVLVGRIVELMQ